MKCEAAKIKPLLKKGIKTKTKNHRVIFLLPLISEVIEKSVHNQKQDYLQTNELLYIYHLHFRTNNSTGTCLSRLIGMVSIDL